MILNVLLPYRCIPGQQYAYYLFIPVGKYAVFVEYLMLIVVGYFIYRAFKKRNVSPDKCNYLMFKFSKVPFLKAIVESLLALIIGYLFYYMSLLYIHKFNLNVYNEKQFEVRVLDVSNRGRKKCKPAIKTNFLNYYNPEKPTLFYKVIKEFSFNRICLYGKHYREGQTVVFDTKETDFGLYVDNVKNKIY